MAGTRTEVRHGRRWFDRFVYWIAAIILLSGWWSKVYLIAASPPFWKAGLDYVTGLTNHQTAVLGLGFDTTALTLVLFSKSDLQRAFALAWAGAAFLSYPLISRAIGAPAACPCLSGLRTLVKLSTRELETLSLAAAIFLVVGGIILCSRTLRQSRESD